MPLTIEISLLLSGVSVACAIFFGICSKQRNEKKDTQEETEQRATTDTMVMVKLENIADDLKDIKREDVFAAIKYEKEFLESNGYWYTVVNDFEVTDEFCQMIKDKVIAKYGEWES